MRKRWGFQSRLVWPEALSKGKTLLSAGLTITIIGTVLLLTRRLELALRGYRWIAANSWALAVLFVTCGGFLFAISFTVQVAVQTREVTILRTFAAVLFVGSFLIARVMKVQAKEILANWEEYGQQFFYGQLLITVFGAVLCFLGLLERIKPH